MNSWLAPAGNEHRVPLAQIDLLPFDVECLVAFEDVVDLVIGMWLGSLSSGDRLISAGASQPAWGARPRTGLG